MFCKIFSDFPDGWWPDLISSFGFFIMDVIVIVILLPMYLKYKEKKRQNEIWAQPRNELFILLTRSFKEIIDALTIMDWAIRQFAVDLSQGIQDRITVMPHKLIGNGLAWQHQEIEKISLMKTRSQASPTLPQDVFKIAAEHIELYVKKSNSEIDGLSMCINEEMADNIAKMMRFLNDMETGVMHAKSTCTLLGMAEIVKEKRIIFEGIFNEETDFLNESRRSMEADLYCKIPRFQIANKPDEEAGKAITLGSQIRELVFTSMAGLINLYSLASMNKKNIEDDILKEIKDTYNRLMWKAHGLVAAGDTIADIFCPHEIRTFWGKGNSLNSTPNDFMIYCVYETGKYLKQEKPEWLQRYYDNAKIE